jgi:predicted kinase
MQQIKKLIILRGLPGAGKSTLAKELAQLYNAVHIEADMYFMQNGKYVFDLSRIFDAHQWCQQAVWDHMRSKHSIILSNTSTTEKELKPYLDLAEIHDYTVVSLVVENRHGNCNIHDVPENTLERMQNRFSIKLR